MGLIHFVCVHSKENTTEDYFGCEGVDHCYHKTSDESFTAALLLRHLFNLGHYCPYGALTFLKIPSFSDHVVL